MRGGPRVLLLLTVIVGMATALIVFFSQHGLYKIYRLRQERARLEGENARIARENARLARTIDRLHQDPEMIQDLIRRDLNFVKKNEIIIQLPGKEGPKPPTGLASQPRAPSPKHQKAGSVSPRQRKKKAPGAPRKAPSN
jgi:cell division protein FtsB